MTEFGALEFSLDGAIARINLNRPDEGNALDERIVFELGQAAQLCNRATGLKVVLLKANGRSFCVGGDIKAFVGFGTSAGAKVKALADELHRAVSIFARMDALLVVAVNGPAAGAGLSLALLGDYVLAAQSATFTMAYTAVGLTPDGGASYYLPRVIGLRRAQELTFTNRTLSADEAAEWGIATRVVSDEALHEEAEALAYRFARGSASAFARTKALLRGSFANDLERQMELEAQGIAASLDSPDGQEGISAFLSKRAPRFT